MTQKELDGKTVSELKDIAKGMGLSGYSSMRKSQLITLIEENQAPPSVAEAEEAAEEAAKVPVKPIKPVKLAKPAKPRPPKKKNQGAVAEGVALVRQSVREGCQQVRVPYVDEDVTKQILAKLTAAERKVTVFGGESRGSVG